MGAPLLSIPSKLLESHICSIIDTHLNSCGTKSCKQWGFSKGLSTEGMLISMTERWKTAIDNGLTVGAVFIDFQKAFDTVPHYILSHKLHAIGISGPLHEWLMSYLTDRRQFTEVNNCRSATDNVRYGVPQGSLLGPRLYTIYVNVSLTTLIQEISTCMQTTLQFTVLVQMLTWLCHH